MLSSFVLILLITAAISFAGSLQLGPVNSAVIFTGMRHGKKQALITASGGIIPELIYSAVAVWLYSQCMGKPDWMIFFSWFTGPLLIVVGIYMMATSGRVKAPEETKEVSGSAHFLKGFTLGMLNPQLLPFWFFILQWLGNRQLIGNDSTQFAGFIAGAALGAWLLLVLCSFLGEWLKTKLFTKHLRLIHLALGLMIALAGAKQLWDAARGF